MCLREIFVDVALFLTPKKSGMTRRHLHFLDQADRWQGAGFCGYNMAYEEILAQNGLVTLELVGTRAERGRFLYGCVVANQTRREARSLHDGRSCSEGTYSLCLDYCASAQ